LYASEEVAMIRIGNDEMNEQIIDRLLRNDDPTLTRLHITFKDAGEEGSNKRERFLYQHVLPVIHLMADRTLLRGLDQSDLDDNTIRPGFHFLIYVPVGTSLQLQRLADVGRRMQNSSNNAAKHNRNLKTLIMSGLSAAEVLSVFTALDAPMEMSCTLYDWVETSHPPPHFLCFWREQVAKTLRLHFGTFIHPTTVADMIESLPDSHSFEVFRIQRNLFEESHSVASLLATKMDDGSAARIVGALCRTPAAKSLTFTGEKTISAVGGTRIIKILQDSDHNFTKVQLFDDDDDGDDEDSDWQNAIRVGIEQHTWAKQFLKLDALTQEWLFPLALKRAEGSDSGHASRAPDMMFYLVKKRADLICCAGRRGH
jgi:hypothetical protein